MSLCRLNLWLLCTHINIVTPTHGDPHSHCDWWNDPETVQQWQAETLAVISCRDAGETREAPHREAACVHSEGGRERERDLKKYINWNGDTVVSFSILSLVFLRLRATAMRVSLKNTSWLQFCSGLSKHKHQSCSFSLEFVLAWMNCLQTPDSFQM